MKLIKAIFNGKGLPKRGEKGFTLVELLIVLAILAVLAAVVIPNVTGMFGRGAQQAYDTDRETVQMAAATFFFDIHKYDATGTTWNNANGVPGHYYPFATAMPYDLTLTVSAVPETYDGGKNTIYLIEEGAGAATDGDILAHTIWTGLLVNSPGLTGATNFSGVAAPVATEKGPYLNEIPKSAAPQNAMTNLVPADSLASGTYTWIVCKDGRVYGVSYLLPDGGTAGNEAWYAGFNGTYP